MPEQVANQETVTQRRRRKLERRRQIMAALTTAATPLEFAAIVQAMTPPPSASYLLFLLGAMTLSEDAPTMAVRASQMLECYRPPNSPSSRPGDDLRILAE